MKVLLIKDVKSLGKAGEVKEVKDGYGKNFLIAKGFAKHATEQVLKEYEKEQQILKEKLDAQVREFSDLKQQIESSKFTIKHKIGANGHLIGSVTNKEISEVLKIYNVTIDKKQIHLENKIKMPGIYEIDCKLGHGIHAKAKIDVIGVQ